jgi:hypothetical protein
MSGPDPVAGGELHRAAKAGDLDAVEVRPALKHSRRVGCAA